jgi:THO complex subunit 2
MPSLADLVNDVGLAIPVAFQLTRPIIRAALAAGTNPLAVPKYLQRWHPFHDDVKELVRTHLPDATWQIITPEFYVTFWSLSLCDIFVPSSRYAQEIKRLRGRYAELDGRGSHGPGGT